MRCTLIYSLIISLYALIALPAASAEEELSLSNGEYAIPGILSLPSRSKARSPAVLLLHGTASQKNEVGNLYQMLAQSLAEANVVSLRIDFAGAGDSEVDHLRYSLSGATRDAQIAFDFLSQHPSVHKEKILVLGFSQGGLIAQRLVLQEPRALALLTWSTAATDGRGSFGDFFREHYAEAIDTGYAKVEFPWLSEALKFSAQWFEEIDAQKTLTAMKDYRQPILSIAGTADTTVPFQQSIDLVESSSHPMSQVVLLAGADHIFNVLDPREQSPKGASSPERLIGVTTTWITELTRRYPLQAED